MIAEPEVIVEREQQFHLLFNETQVRELVAGRIPDAIKEQAQSLLDFSLETVGQGRPPAKARPRRR